MFSLWGGWKRVLYLYNSPEALFHEGAFGSVQTDLKKSKGQSFLSTETAKCMHRGVAFAKMSNET